MPRHSSGCRNCVRRHILCDKSYPTCKNCENRALTCDGRREGCQFVHVIHCSKPIPRRRSAFPRSTDWSERARSSSLKHLQSPIPQYAEGFADFNAQFCFLLTTVGREDSIWLKHCICDAASHPISGFAITALCTARFAKKYRDYRLLAIATERYVKALGILCHELDKSNYYQFDVLAAIAALNRYEILVCTAERSWVQHAGGISKVIELMGPEKFSEYPYNTILRSNRFRIIHEAYYRRKSTFLRQDQWREIRTPASNVDLCFYQLEDFYGVLTEIAARVTPVLQHGDVMQDNQASFWIKNLLKDLDQWMADWMVIQNFEPVKGVNTVDDSFYSDADGLIFMDSLDYPSIIDAVGMNLCRALKLTALEWQQKLEQPQWWAGAGNQNMVDIPQARVLARDICCSLHLYFDSQNVSNVSNVSSLLHSAIVAHKAFRRNSREMRWLQGLLNRVADLTGVEVARSFISCYENKWSPR